MLHMLLGGAGCGKSEAMIAEIKRAADAGADVRTLAHEIGHAFGLRAHWYRSRSPIHTTSGCTTGSARRASTASEPEAFAA